MSYWKAWTSSCPSTWSVSASEAPDGQDDAPLEGLRDAARAFAGSAAERVRLLEVGLLA
jgi:hypothetical protein